MGVVAPGEKKKEKRKKLSISLRNKLTSKSPLQKRINGSPGELVAGIRRAPSGNPWRRTLSFEHHPSQASEDRGEFRPRQTRQLPRAVDLKGRLLSCQSY